MDGPELTHHGVKGMHWGKRKVPEPAGPAPKAPRRKADSEDVKVVGKHLTAVETHGTRVLSNADLQKVIARMNLERQYATLTEEKSVFDTGHSTVKKILELHGTAARIHKTLDDPLTKDIEKALKRARTFAKAARTVHKVATHPASKAVALLL